MGCWSKWGGNPVCLSIASLLRMVLPSFSPCFCGAFSGSSEHVGCGSVWCSRLFGCCFGQFVSSFVTMYIWTRFSSGPPAHPEPSTNSVLLRLCWSQSAMLPSHNSLCVITKSWQLKDHSRWVFRKNLIEFLIGLTTYLYYFYKWLYTTSPRSHVFLEYSTITCLCHMI